MRTALLGAVIAVLVGCRTSPPPPAPAALANISAAPHVHTYRKASGQSLEAYVFPPTARDASKPASAILLFHGGGWSAGSPEWTFPAARRFAARGMVAISIEYRLSEGDVTPIDALADVCAAFRWARERADSLGLDRDRVAGYGVSAGGHLVASVATVGCPAQGAIALRPEPDALLLWSPAVDVAGDGWFERKLQGRALAEEYSPAEHVRAATPQTIIVQGREDNLTPLSGAQRFCDRLIAAGGSCELHVYSGVGHLLTRNLEHQESGFDPDPAAVADGVAQHLRFLVKQGFIAPERR